jgi:hypothetical protein
MWSMQEERVQARARKRFKGALKARMVETLAELAHLHNDVESVVVERLHHARVRVAVLA